MQAIHRLHALRTLILGFMLLSCAVPAFTQTYNAASVCLDADDASLAQLINDYRRQNGLPAVPISPALVFVAQTHVQDITANPPNAAQGCNLHSWSDKGSWTACCYTGREGECMWRKPRELTGFTANGYENGFRSSDTATAQGALNAWQNSTAGHNDVILNRSIWARYSWKAMGVAVGGNYAFVWFADSSDPAGFEARPCTVSRPESNTPTPSLTLYPNPTAGLLHVLNAPHSTLVITDIVSKAVLTCTLPAAQSDTTIDASALPAGVYCATVHSPQGTYAQKFIKQ